MSWWPDCWYKAAALQDFQLLSPVRTILQRPAVSPKGRWCSLRQLQLQRRRKHQSHWSGFIGKNCIGTTYPPEGYLSSAFQQLKTAKPTFSSQIPPLQGWWLKPADFILRLGFFPNMDKSLGDENQAIPPVNNKARPSTFLQVHIWRGNGCSEIKQLKKKKKSLLVPDNKPIRL